MELVLLKQQLEEAREKASDMSSTKTRGGDNEQIKKDRGKYFPLSKQSTLIFYESS